MNFFQSISAINQLLRDDLTKRLHEEIDESSRGFQCGVQAQESATAEIEQLIHDMGQEAENFLNPIGTVISTGGKQKHERDVTNEGARPGNSQIHLLLPFLSCNSIASVTYYG